MKNDEDKCISNKLKKNKDHFLPLAILVMIIGFVSCSKDNDPAPPVATTAPPAACKVQSQSTSGTGKESETVTYTYDFIFTFTYDERGNQTASNSSYKYIYNDGKTQISSNAVSSQYDENDFLLRTVYQYNATGKDGATRNINTNIEYTYSDELLSKSTYTSTDNGKVTNYTTTYEYNPDSKLIKYTSSYDNSYATFEWSGNKVVKITRVDKVGNTNSPFLEYNNDGLLIKSIETRGGLSDEFRYQYDANGQQIRFERYINAKPSSANTYEYDTKESPNKQLYPKAKGHPFIPGTQADYIYNNNLTKSTYYSADPVTSEWKLENSNIYTHDYNGKNLPVESISQVLDKNGVQISTSRTSFQYLDCQ